MFKPDTDPYPTIFRKPDPDPTSFQCHKISGGVESDDFLIKVKELKIGVIFKGL